MTLSICIPIYNNNVSSLIQEISTQTSQLSCNYEIILMDDGSQCHKPENSQLTNLPNVQYIELSSNIGRSAIRNKLADTAQYDYLLFMDCDTFPTSSQFIHNYIEAAESSGADVIIGGYHYKKEKPAEEYLLRWTYGLNREEKSAAERNQHPFRSFSTFNFFIKKEVFNHVRFDETLKEYGHEDTLFGWDMKRHQFKFLHIDNPATHLAYEKTDDFLEKTKSSLKNLWIIYQKNNDKKDLLQDIKVLRYQSFLQKSYLLRPISYLLSHLEKYFIRNLSSENPQMFIFDLYKLNVLCKVSLEKK
ncbi:MAG: glycosyltransferase [Paludibacteraceae bacterium]|nr:glycosyltransferase [Paludibacteraceae bacterium]